MGSRSTFGLAAMLLASLALNARLLLSRPDARPAATKSSAAAPCAPVPCAPTARAEPASCERRLEECQKQGWDLAARAMAAETEPRPGGPSDAGALASTPAMQRASLCAKAEIALRLTWLRDREQITAGLVQSLGDRPEQERNVDREVARMREATGLGPHEAAALDSAYRASRLTRVAAAQAALAREPRDPGVLLEQARGLFADEDALLAKAGGAAARDAWRAEQVDARTTFLAIAATMADKDWDESIQW